MNELCEIGRLRKEIVETIYILFHKVLYIAGRG